MEEPLIEVSVPIQANVNPLSELAGNLISGNSGKQDEVILQDVLDLEDPNPSSFQYEDEQMPRRRIIFRRGLKQPFTMSCSLEDQQESYVVPPAVLPLSTDNVGDVVTPYDNEVPDPTYTWPVYTLKK